MFSILAGVKYGPLGSDRMGAPVAGAEPVPVVNRRDPRPARRAPRLTRRRAREVPVDPPGRAVSWALFAAGFR
jgi:hypothetical protein